MIKYRLECNNCGKSFDSWFSSSSEFEKLKSKKFLDCHFCNSKNIKKTRKFKEKFWNFKILLVITLKMWVMILSIKLDPFITIEKKILKEYMVMQQKNR